MTIAEQIEAIQVERDQANAAFDARIAELKELAIAELEQARQMVSKLESVLGKRQPIPAPQARVLTAIDETDAGNGVGEVREQFDSAQDFTDELAELRARSQARRRR